MKPILLTAFMAMIFTFTSCKKNNENGPYASTSFYQQIVGKWAPYQLVYSDGNTVDGNFASRNFFGAYDESVLFRDDRTYTPLHYMANDNSYSPDHSEDGTFEYSPGKTLILSSVSDIIYTVDKFEGDELWLMDLSGTLHKLRRKPY